MLKQDVNMVMLRCVSNFLSQMVLISLKIVISPHQCVRKNACQHFYVRWSSQFIQFEELLLPKILCGHAKISDYLKIKFGLSANIQYIHAVVVATEKEILTFADFSVSSVTAVFIYGFCSCQIWSSDSLKLERSRKRLQLLCKNCHFWRSISFYLGSTFSSVTANWTVFNSLFNESKPKHDEWIWN